MTDVETNITIIKSFTARSGVYGASLKINIPKIRADYVIELSRGSDRDKIIIKDKAMLIGIHKVIDKYLESLK